ncbi:MAG: helix-turn-helix transcriptional regulator [Oscillospiraceae bacterium]|nr:helix-turn-helix transcriptional regulator [Oscillospiraceae bacterium]
MENIQIAFGAHIRKLRSAKGFSQEKFALHIGMDRTYYASVEKGRRNISIVNIQKIANGLNVSLSELFDGIEEE